MLTQHQEDYLRALYFLDEEKGELRSIDIANYLQISKPSVSEMLRTLEKQNLVSFAPYSKVRLTKSGRKAAERITSKHRIIETFLKKVLKKRQANLHEEAHRLEHAFSDESIQRLSAYMGNPRTDPHGKFIPIFLKVAHD